MSSRIHFQINGVDVWERLTSSLRFCAGLEIRGILPAAAWESDGTREGGGVARSARAQVGEAGNLDSFQLVLQCDPSQLIQRHLGQLLMPQVVRLPCAEGPVRGLGQLKLTTFA